MSGIAYGESVVGVLLIGIDEKYVPEVGELWVETEGGDICVNDHGMVARRYPKEAIACIYYR